MSRRKTLQAMSVRVDPDVRRVVTRTARRSGLTRSQVLRCLLEGSLTLAALGAAKTETAATPE